MNVANEINSYIFYLECPKFINYALMYKKLRRVRSHKDRRAVLQVFHLNAIKYRSATKLNGIINISGREMFLIGSLSDSITNSARGRDRTRRFHARFVIFAQIRGGLGRGTRELFYKAEIIYSTSAFEHPSKISR